MDGLSDVVSIRFLQLLKETSRDTKQPHLGGSVSVLDPHRLTPIPLDCLGFNLILTELYPLGWTFHIKMILLSDSILNGLALAGVYQYACVYTVISV